MYFVQRIEALASDVASLVTNPDSSIYWGFLLSTLILVGLIYVVREKSLNPAAFLHFCLPRHIYLARGFFHDSAMFLINSLSYSYFILPYMLTSGVVLVTVGAWLEAGLGPVATPSDGPWAIFALTACVMLAADLGFFLSHYLQHKISWLWEFHKVHHSAITLNPLTAFRRHPVDIMVEANISGVLTGTVFGAFDYLAGRELPVVEILGVHAGIFIFTAIGAHLQHSHIWLSYGRIGNHIIVSPAMHHIHHSKDARHHDRNFGNIFSLWDWLTGSLYVPRQKETLRLGLARDEEREYQGLVALYMRPFVMLVRRLRP